MSLSGRRGAAQELKGLFVAEARRAGITIEKGGLVARLAGEELYDDHTIEDSGCDEGGFLCCAVLLLGLMLVPWQERG